jgi:hypothetical protein
MRKTRERRRDGLRVIPVEIRESELDALVLRGLLAPGERGDREAVATAIGLVLDGLKW